MELGNLLLYKTITNKISKETQGRDKNIYSITYRDKWGAHRGNFEIINTAIKSDTPRMCV